MSLEVRLPELGGSVTHARLIAWLKQEGDSVRGGEPIAEVETDKTSVEIEAPADGVLAKIHVAAGADQVPVNSVIALIAVDSAAPGTGASGAPPPATGSAPASVAPVEQAPPIPPGTVAGRTLEIPAPPAPTPETARPESEIPASPLARRMAYAAGLSLADIRGSGPSGRITKEDVEALLSPNVQRRRTSSATLAGGPSAASGDSVERAASTAEYEVQQLTALRRVTAERLTHAKQTIPHFYLRVDCSMDAVSRVREKLNARGQERFSFTVFTIRAAALALRKVPAANAMWVDGEVRLWKTIDIALAVNTPAGLITPVIRRADEKSLLALVRESRAFAEAARSGRLKPDDYTGASFTLSNLGMYGVTSLYPIISAPQACILGVGAIEQRPVVRDGALAIGSMMTCTLSADHRAIDGAAGAEFLGSFRQLIEDPWSLIL